MLTNQLLNNMKTKQIIILIIVIIALGGSGIFLYMAFNPKKASNIPTNAAGAIANTTASAPTASGTSNPKGSSGGTKKATQAPAGSAILPHGTKLDFDTIKRFNPSGRRFAYPVVKPEEAGSSLSDIISKK